jgi:hypothetical protein
MSVLTDVSFALATGKGSPAGLRLPPATFA